jgi:hypothetical protein
MKALNRISITLIAGLLLFIAAMASGADQFVPARLRVQALGVGTAPPSTGGVKITGVYQGSTMELSGGNAFLYGPDNDNYVAYLVGHNDTDGGTADFCLEGAVTKCSLSGSSQDDLILRTCGDGSCDTMNPGGRLLFDNTDGTGAKEICLSNGTGCPGAGLIMYAVNDAGCGTLSCNCIASATVYNGNAGTVACSRAAQGRYLFSFTNSNVACTATPNLAVTSNRNVATIEPISATQFRVHVQSDDSVDTDAHFNITCMGTRN